MGEDSPLEIDHKDRDGFNNTWSNLRAATRQLNVDNSSHVENSGLPAGIQLAMSNKNPYRVVYRGKYIGCYPTLEEAMAVRLGLAYG